MLRINLTPPEELENPLWWVPDVIFLVTIFISGFFGIQFYMSDSLERITDYTAETKRIERNINALAGDVAIHDKLNKELKALNSNLKALETITLSQTQKFLPIIVLEHLQNLKPAGVWFSSLNFGAGAQPKTRNRRRSAKKENTEESLAIQGQVTITGMALDNLLVAEFLSSLRATQLQEIDPSDIRTRIYFEEVQLNNSALTRSPLQTQRVAPGVEVPMIPQFTIVLKYKERSLVVPAVALWKPDFEVFAASPSASLLLEGGS